MSARQPACRQDLLGTGGGPSIADVILEGAMTEQKRFLQYDGEPGAKVVFREIPDISPVEKDLAAFDVVEAADQIDQRGFSGAASADDADTLAGPDREIQVL
ncbi:MAG: hypothetical protein A2428_11960 [Bdellovibrionales bacterium RIFOXYC1_FULL_54_43]|nr:MAG: hypothetical protein A2428_11960 [Bdellovibrionales bacterium RIFOXYC1_FULL_54_43]